MRGLCIFVLSPVLVFLIGTMIISFVESGLSINYEGPNDLSEHVFSISNNGEIDMEVTYAASGVLSESYVADIGKLDRKKVIPIDNGRRTMLLLDGRLFMPNREDFAGGGIIKNLISIGVNHGERKRFVVENINKGDLSQFIADFYIVIESRPSNMVLYPFHKLLHLIGIRKGNSGAFFTIEEGRIIDFGDPFKRGEFQERIKNRLRAKPTK